MQYNRERHDLEDGKMPTITGRADRLPTNLVETRLGHWEGQRGAFELTSAGCLLDMLLDMRILRTPG